MKTYAIDLESYYSKDHSVQTLGSINYLRHALTDIYLLSVAGEGYRWQGRPEEFDWSLFKEARVVAHNYSFDGALFRVRGLPEPPDFNCTANLAAYLGSPRALDKAAAKLLGVEVSKATRAQMKGREWASLSGKEQDELRTYNMRDAELSLELWRKYSSQWPEQEQELSRQTILMCWDGICLDRPALKAGIEKAYQIRAEALKGIPWAAREGDPPLSYQKARAHCAKVGIPSPGSFNEKDEGYRAWEAEYGKAHEFVSAQRDYRKANNTHIKKMEAMARRIMPNGRMNYELLYAGAHTLRWAGAGGLNLQNLLKEPWRGLDPRGLLVPEEGRKFINSDLSAIEPRVLMWIAGEERILAALHKGFNFYEAQATAWGLWRGAPGALKTENPALYNGLLKPLSLGCGYGQGAKKFRSVCAERGIVLTEKEAERMIAQYRANNPKVVQLWDRLGYELQLQVRKGVGRLSLPSGRSLVYPDLRWEAGAIWSTLVTERGWTRVKLWGGTLCENACQAIARDIFALAWLRLVRAGYRVVLTVHDEWLIEAPMEADPADVVRLVTVCPDWIPGLPLAASAKELMRYVK